MEYLSVNKFAEKVGVSRQAIYQRIKRAEPDFMQYVKKEGNAIKISETAAILFDNIDVDCKDNNVNIDTDCKGEDVNVNAFCKSDSVNIDTNYISIDNSCKHENVNKSNDSVNIDNSCKDKNDNVNINNVNIDIEQMQKQISSLIEIQSKHLSQIENLYVQLKDKDKLIEELSKQILSQTRLPIIVDPPKQSFFHKIKWKLFKK